MSKLCLNDVAIGPLRSWSINFLLILDFFYFFGIIRKINIKLIGEIHRPQERLKMESFKSILLW